MKNTLIASLMLLALTLLNIPSFAQEGDNSNTIISKFDFIPGEKVYSMMILHLKKSEIFRHSGTPTPVVKLLNTVNTRADGYS